MKRSLVILFLLSTTLSCLGQSTTVSNKWSTFQVDDEYGKETQLGMVNPTTQEWVIYDTLELVKKLYKYAEQFKEEARLARLGLKKNSLAIKIIDDLRKENEKLNQMVTEYANRWICKPDKQDTVITVYTPILSQDALDEIHTESRSDRDTIEDIFARIEHRMANERKHILDRRRKNLPPF